MTKINWAEVELLLRRAETLQDLEARVFRARMTLGCSPTIVSGLGFEPIDEAAKRVVGAAFEAAELKERVMREHFDAIRKELGLAPDLADVAAVNEVRRLIAQTTALKNTAADFEHLAECREKVLVELDKIMGPGDAQSRTGRAKELIDQIRRLRERLV